jgi:hypothetical protein
MGDLGLSLLKLARYEGEEGAKCGQYTDLGVGARAVATDAQRVGTAAVKQSRLARMANGQAMEALEPLHDELAMSPVREGAVGKGPLDGWTCGAEHPDTREQCLYAVASAPQVYCRSFLSAEAFACRRWWRRCGSARQRC